MGKNSRAEKPDARGGSYFLLPHCLLKSEAWRTASPRAVKALLVLCQRHNGFNNGRIGMSLEELAIGMDSQNHKGNAKALAELHARGIAVLARNYPKSSRMAREYRLTFVPTEGSPATHEYVEWRSGDLGTRKKPTVETAKETSSFIAETAAGRKLSTAETTAAKNLIDAKPPFFPSGSVADSTGHIVSHSRGSGSHPSHPRRKQGGPRTSTAADAGVTSAAPSEEELRERTLALIQRLGRGSQGRLAESAGIPGGTLSKFLHNGGPLNAHARIRLACAFPKTENAHLRNERAA